MGPEAVYLGYYEGQRFEANQVVSNTTDIGIRLLQGNGPVPTLAHNIVARSGETSLKARAYDLKPLHARLLHNTLAGGGSGIGVHVETGYVTLELINNIVAHHESGIVNDHPSSSTVSADYTLFWSVVYEGSPNTNPVYGNPLFMDPDGSDYHISNGSAAIDAALEAGEVLDVDGDKRPIGPAPDIGADEAWVWVYLPLVLRGG